jgi:hypothetical protein
MIDSEEFDRYRSLFSADDGKLHGEITLAYASNEPGSSCKVNPAVQMGEVVRRDWLL